MLQPVLDILVQPLSDLGAVRAVKETVADAPERVLEVWRQSQHLKMVQDLLHKHQHLVSGQFM
jgi:hypothetical protein